MYRKYFKRPLDFIMALVGLIVLSPVLLITAILVRIKLGTPVIFKQPRPGLNERIFTLYKFRTMNDERNENGELLPDAIRLTKFGKFLRSTSIDELPELWNILEGEMSFVGPRPQLVKDMVFMTSEQRMRHSVHPGLTGWAQVNGRNDVTWEEKLFLDLEYVEQISLLKDSLILVKTVRTVVKRDGVVAKGMETAEDLGEYLLRKNKIDMTLYNKGIYEAHILELKTNE